MSTATQERGTLVITEDFSEQKRDSDGKFGSGAGGGLPKHDSHIDKVEKGGAKSEGGGPSHSDQIHHAANKAKETGKPVYVTKNHKEGPGHGPNALAYKPPTKGDYHTVHPDGKITYHEGAPKKAKAHGRMMFARAVEASVSGEAPEAARLWCAGWNRTDKGDLNFTPRSAELVMRAAEARNNPLAWYYEHEDRVPLEKRGGAPMRGVCSAPSSVLTVRESDDGPECWAENISWTDEARRQIKTGERRQLSPIAAYDSETREIVEILNVSLCAEGATLTGTILASAGRKTEDMFDELLKALLDTVNAGDFEAANGTIAEIEGMEGGGALADTLKGMMAVIMNMTKEEPAEDEVATKKLAVTTVAASRGPVVVNEAFARGMAQLEAATANANAAAKRSDKAAVVTLIAASREFFDPTDEREHLKMCDPVATERHVATMRRKMSKTGILAASRGTVAGGANPPGPKASVDETHGLDVTEIQAATRMNVPLADYAASKQRNVGAGKGV